MTNPTKDLIKLSINNDATTEYTAELFTQDGKRIAVQNHQHISGTSVVTLKAPRATGMYYVRITNNGLVTDILKVIVE